MKERFMRFAKTKRYSIPALIAFAALLVWLNAARGGEPQFATREAARATVAQEVTVTGAVKSAGAVDLAFERGGKLASLRVAVGDTVSQGQTLAVISNSDLNAELESRLAALDRERIRLSELKGRSGADGRASASVRSAETALSNARLALVDRANDAFVKADDAVRNHADRLFKDPTGSASFGIEVSSGATTYRIDTSDYGKRIEINAGRREAEAILQDWTPLGQAADEGAVDAGAASAEQGLVKIQKLLGDIASVINSLESDSATTNAVYGEYRTDISSARSSVNTALSGLRSAAQAYESAKTGLEVASRPGGADEIAIQESNVRSAQAQVDAVRADIAKTMIIAPVTGTVAKVDARVGEIVPANVALISLIAESTLEIEANIPEADIAKVRPGAEAEVTFDAYGSDYVMRATVASIDPAETLIDGVPTYRAILRFLEADERIKSGMTANVDIKGETRENVVAIPQRSVITRGSERYVRVLEGGAAVERKVKIGLRGSDGTVEVLEGVAEGETVVTAGEEE